MPKQNQVFRSYFGGKNGNGVYHTIINSIRPHTVYMELFAGSGAIIQYKKPAITNIVNDIDEEVYKKWIIADIDIPNLSILNQDTTQLLKTYPFQADQKYCIYLDPPYPLTSRKSSREVYGHEMTDSQHEDLLQTLLSLASRAYIDIIVSTYPNELYQSCLSEWNLITFQAQTRHGLATECLYMNYVNDEGILHQYDYLGRDFTDRQRIKRKIDREIKKLRNLPAPERNAIIQAVLSDRY